MNTFTEENYLKAIYNLSRNSPQGVSTNAIAERLDTKASSVTDMIKKLADKKLVKYKKYKGSQLTEKGKTIAVTIIRNHRLWEYFLVEKLKFKWDEVHDIAEQMEHIGTRELTDRLEKFLDFPEYDPHGDPIPDKEGNIYHHKDVTVADLKPGESGVIVGVKDHSKSYLKYLEKMDLLLGNEVKTTERYEFDGSMLVSINNKEERTLSSQVCENLLVRKNWKENGN